MTRDEMLERVLSGWFAIVGEFRGGMRPAWGIWIERPGSQGSGSW